MENLADEHPGFLSMTLGEIALPGTHNSGSYQIEESSDMAPNAPTFIKNLSEALENLGIGRDALHEACANWSRCQGSDIHEQLKDGVRYLDLRVCEHDGDLWLCHGQVSVTVDTALRQVHRFLERLGTEEVVILHFNSFYSMDDSDHNKLCRKLRSKFDRWICSAEERGPRSTYGDLRQNDERVVVIYQDDHKNARGARMVSRYPWLWGSDKNISSPWPDTDETGELARHLRKHNSNWSGITKPSRFNVAQAQLTPSTAMATKAVAKPVVEAWNAVIKVFGAKPDPVVKSARELAVASRELLCDWLDQCARTRGQWHGECALLCMHA